VCLDVAVLTHENLIVIIIVIAVIAVFAVLLTRCGGAARRSGITPQLLHHAQVRLDRYCPGFLQVLELC